MQTSLGKTLHGVVAGVVRGQSPPRLENLTPPRRFGQIARADQKAEPKIEGMHMLVDELGAITDEVPDPRFVSSLWVAGA